MLQYSSQSHLSSTSHQGSPCRALGVQPIKNIPCAFKRRDCFYFYNFRDCKLIVNESPTRFLFIAYSFNIFIKATYFLYTVLFLLLFYLSSTFMPAGIPLPVIMNVLKHRKWKQVQLLNGFLLFPLICVFGLSLTLCTQLEMWNREIFSHLGITLSGSII